MDVPSTSGSFRPILLNALLVICIISYWFSPISVVPIEDVVAVDFDGPFSTNTKLSEGIRIPMFAPESIVEDKDRNLYVGLRDGRVVKIHPSSSGKIGEGRIEELFNGKLDTVTTTDLPHGIPLGLRLRGKVLYIMDAIYGFVALDLSTRRTQVIIKPTDVSPAMKFPNDFDIDSTGTMMYFTDTSHRHSIKQIIQEALEGTCTGRLFSFNLRTNTLTLLTSDLCFANGVQLTTNENFVIVSETTRYRVSWIDVRTGKKKTTLHLPAMPDNVRRNRHGSYYIGASAKLTTPFKFLLGFPSLRRFLVGILPESVLMMVPNRKHNMLFEASEGKVIISTLHDPNGNLTYALSQGTELSDGRIALGSYAAGYLALADIN